MSDQPKNRRQAVLTHVGLGLLWLLHWLPLPVLAALGVALGRVAHVVSKPRRRIALRNLALCFPDMPPAERERLVRRHFEWFMRSALERCVLWYAPVSRLRRLIQVEGDVGFAQRTGQPVMWLVPHFVGLDIAAVAAQLFQPRQVVSMYQVQSNPVFEDAMKRGRLRFNGGVLLARSERALALVKAIKKGLVFINLPDMDFGLRDAAFVPFFGVPAATLLAPSRLAKSLGMTVQPIVAEMLPGGRGYRVRFCEPWAHFPTDDAVADTAGMNRWIESEILRNPAQYLWVHKRFKTRPEGEPSLYG
jgi:KDO2-lipid IV(A) lauroyltransferase